VRDRTSSSESPLVLEVRAGGPVRSKACYVASGVNLEGERDVLGLSS
jgi:transposase-like protein